VTPSPDDTKILSPADHPRDSAGLRYVYPVVSRRAGGVSVGINLNPNNACNWRCIYCQVPNLRRGTAPRLDLDLLENELREFLAEALHGRFLRDRVPEGARRINDIALSGNGEPTTSRQFGEVIERIARVRSQLALPTDLKLVLITNGSMADRPAVRAGIGRMATLNGEVWFKVDSATRAGMLRLNGVRGNPDKALENLRVVSALCPTWIQTCLFALDGEPPSGSERRDYVGFVRRCMKEGMPLRGVLLYGLARPSHQPEAARLAPLPKEWPEGLAEELRACGLTVKVSP
jgi:wyosine [tRNA(Phe)-imidazoG37] synthetase (radical SAM superfamily)